ncbi:MAG: hypothetical protein AB8B61_01780, partial [Cyclobacteriaceae bacterium]
VDGYQAFFGGTDANLITGNFNDITEADLTPATAVTSGAFVTGATDWKFADNWILRDLSDIKY